MLRVTTTCLVSLLFIHHVQASPVSATALNHQSPISTPATHSAFPIQSIRQSVIADSKRFIGLPYRWGGTTPRGFDCSGFVQYLYRQEGIHLPRTARAQYASLKPTEEPKPGDLLYFRRGRHITHVAMYIGHNQMIHVPRTGERIRIEAFDAHWKRRLAGVRTITPATKSHHLLYAYAQHKIATPERPSFIKVEK